MLGGLVAGDLVEVAEFKGGAFFGGEKVESVFDLVDDGMIFEVRFFDMFGDIVSEFGNGDEGVFTSNADADSSTDDGKPRAEVFFIVE